VGTLPPLVGIFGNRDLWVGGPGDVGLDRTDGSKVAKSGRVGKGKVRGGCDFFDFLMRGVFIASSGLANEIGLVGWGSGALCVVRCALTKFGGIWMIDL
jgi:hypothetical protein